MALWQITFQIVPSYSSVKPSALETDDYDYWADADVMPDIFSKLVNVLPMGESWSQSTVLYGNQESTCIEVMMRNHAIVDVSLRVDFRTKYEGVVRTILEFCNANSMILLDHTGRRVEMNYKTVNEYIQNSYQIATYRRLSGG